MSPSNIQLDAFIRFIRNLPAGQSEQPDHRTSFRPSPWTMSWTVTTQPQMVTSYNAAGDWSTGICDCCQDMKQCCFACWCCPCFACRTSEQFGQSLCLPLLDIFACCIRPITMSMRASMRHVYGIKGSLCNDCLYSTFCVSCVWCQMATEIKKRQIPTMLSDIISR